MNNIDNRRTAIVKDKGKDKGAIKVASKPKAKGDCYEANAKKFMEHIARDKRDWVDYKLCHGVVINQMDKKPMGHAWIELTMTMGKHTEVIVLDYANGHAHKLGRDTYYIIGDIKPENVKRYTIDEVRQWLLKTEHWGHWELNVNR